MFWNSDDHPPEPRIMPKERFKSQRFHWLAYRMNFTQALTFFRFIRVAKKDEMDGRN